MDTATHFVMGIALGGLALADPVVANSAPTTVAVMTAVIIGSQAPDVDTVLKLRNNAVYIRHHRGITHSLPAVVLWPLLITAILSFLFTDSNLLHLWLWTQLAVALHVFVDIFNAYGTQALRPFSNKWVALGVINTFDPFIFIMHCVGIAVWAFGANPVTTFITIYIVIIGYYIVRFMLQRAIKHTVHHLIKDEELVIVAPTIRFWVWRVAAVSGTHYYVGSAYGRSVTIYDEFEILPMPKTKTFDVALAHPNFQSFVSFSPLYNWELSELENGLTEIRLIDLRYRSNDRYNFVAVAHLNSDDEIVNSFTGWIYSEDKLQRKLQVGSSRKFWGQYKRDNE